MPSLQRTAIDIGESYTNHGLSLVALKQLQERIELASKLTENATTRPESVNPEESREAKREAAPAGRP